MNANSSTGDSGCKELTFICGFDANVALVLEGLGQEKDKVTSPKSGPYLWPSLGGWY